jgi:hypothetical protein
LTTKVVVGLVLLGMVCAFSGCARDDSAETGVTVPRVTEIYPADGSMDVGLTTFISVRFSENMDAGSLDSIYVEGVPTHHVEYDAGEKRAVVYLDTLLAPETAYEIHVSSAVRDIRGNPIAADTASGFTTGPLDCEHLRDMFEPNRDAASAPHIEIGRTYPLLSSCGDEERNDVFHFTLSDTVKVTARTELVYADTEYIAWNMNFEREDGSFYDGIGTSFRPERKTPAHDHTFLPGTYYLHVWKCYVDQHEVVYHLTMVTSEPCADDPYEDNDFIDQAVPIEPGTIYGLRGCGSDGDFFSVTLSEGQTLTVTATEVSSIGGNRMIEIFGPSRNRLTGHVDEVNPAVEDWTALEAGIYAFWVYWIRDGIVYDLEIEVTGP